MSKNEKKLESDRRKKMKFSKGSANITDMFLKNRKTKKTKGNIKSVYRFTSMYSVNVKINDDDDLNNIMREIDGTSASNVMSAKKTEKEEEKNETGNYINNG